MLFNTYLNILLKIWILILFGLAFDYPEALGHWKAQFDISYYSIMNEYYADCDCTELLE